MVIVKEVKTPNNFGSKGYLGFERLTMVSSADRPCQSRRDDTVIQCPMQKTLVQLDLLTGQERAWLNAYHAETLEKVSPLLKNDQRALAWLIRECSPF